MQGHRGVSARPRLLLCRTVGQAGPWATPACDVFCSAVTEDAGHAPSACGAAGLRFWQTFTGSVGRYSSHQAEIIHIPFRRRSVIGAAIVASSRATG